MNFDLEEAFEDERWKLLAFVNARKILADGCAAAIKADAAILTCRKQIRAYETLRGCWSTEVPPVREFKRPNRLSNSAEASGGKTPPPARSDEHGLTPQKLSILPAKSKALTSWKDVASHLRKSVRTVQRWEQVGLPIRRPSPNAPKSPILAFTCELDAWLVAYFSNIAAECESNICLSQQERLALPARARSYIRELEEEISERNLQLPTFHG